MTFRLGKCRVTVSFYFFAMTALACCIDGGDILLSGMIAAAIHESGHILAMIAIPGQRIDSLDITALGIRITSQHGDMTRGWWITAAAGIIANLAAAGMIWAIPGKLHLEALSGANICLAAVNFCPIVPLDGGQLIRIALDRHFDFAAAERISLAISIAALIPLTACGLYILMRSRGNFSLLALCLWLLSCILKEYI